MTRILPRADYGRLVGTYLEPLREVLPADAEVIVMEDDGGAIIACAAIFSRDHLEGTWIAEPHRGRAIVARHMVDAIQAVAARRGADVLVTAASDGLMVNLLFKLGASLMNATHWVWPMRRT